MKSRSRSALLSFAVLSATLALGASSAGCNAELQVDFGGTGGAAATTGSGGGAGGSDVVPDPASCNPIRTDGACLLPYPSAVFLDVDASTKTGLRVALKSEQFAPSNDTKAAFDPVRLNEADGFSPASEILAYFPEHLEGSSLVPIGDPAKSLEDASATVVVDVETGVRVAHFAELDAYAAPDNNERQALIIRPSKRLESGKRYAVAITKALKTKAGGVPAVPPRFAAILNGDAEDDVAKKQLARMPDILDALGKASVAKEDLLLAWDFVTASDESQLRILKPLQEATLAAIGDAGLGFAITSVEPDFSTRLAKRVRGTFKVPKFLTNIDPKVPETALVRDAAGKPVQDGTYDAPFTVIIPRAAATLAAGEKLHFVLFGHGFLGSGEGELSKQPDSGDNAQQIIADSQKIAFIATDWPGLVDGDQNSAFEALGDMNKVPYIVDRLTQAVVNAVTLARVAPEIAKAPELEIGDVQVVDDSRIDYAGFSLGGVLGGVVLGLSPDLERGVFHTGAGQWSALLQRSKNWGGFAIPVDLAYPDRVDQQILVNVLQEYFTPIDPITLAPTLLQGGLTTQPKKVLLQMSQGDASVPNLASHIAARTMGLPLLTPAPVGVFDVPEAAGPLPSALAIWDTKPEPLPPDTNLALPITTENKAHDVLRRLPLAQQQLGKFIADGEITSPCDGPCDPT